MLDNSKPVAAEYQSRKILVQIDFRLTASDLLEAHTRHGGRELRVRQAIGLLLVAAGIITAFENPKNFAMVVFAIVLGLFLVFGLWFLSMRAYKTDGRLHHEFTAAINEDGIALNAGPTKSEYDWASFTRVVETENLFMLYQAPRVFNVFPKRAFPSSSAAEFRSLATQKIRPGAGRSPLGPRVWIFLAVVVAGLVLLVMAIRNIH